MKRIVFSLVIMILCCCACSKYCTCSINNANASDQSSQNTTQEYEVAYNENCADLSNANRSCK